MEHHDRRTHSTPRCSQRTSGRVLRDTEHFHHDPFATFAQLGVGRLQIDHQVAVGLADANHRTGRQDVEHQLGCCPRLESCRSGHDLGSHIDLYHHIALLPHIVGRLGAGEQHGAHPPRARARERRPDVRGGTARGDADEHIVGAEVARVDGGGTGIAIVFRAFDRPDQRLGSASDDPLDHLGWRPEGRRALGSIEDAEATRRACPDIAEPATSSEGRLDQTHRRGDRLGSLPDRKRDTRILGREQLDELQRIEVVDRDRSRVASFRGAQRTSGVSHRQAGTASGGSEREA